MRADVVESLVAQHVTPGSLDEQWDIPGLERTLEAELNLKLPVKQWLEADQTLEEGALRKRIVEAAHKQYQDKISAVDPAGMRGYEKATMLQSLDMHWREHLSALDYLRQGIHLRGYAQKNPTQEYKREAFELFSMLLETIKTDVTRILMLVQIRSAEELQHIEEPEMPTNVQYQHPEFADTGPAAPDMQLEEEGDVAVLEKPQPFVRPGQKVGRNDPCPCGSGKKYKHCHGRLT
jgi:preprotein translocase subunit SecA